eukprot:7433-Heterococcus_DN1.PRE.2
MEKVGIQAFVVGPLLKQPCALLCTARTAYKGRRPLSACAFGSCVKKAIEPQLLYCPLHLAVPGTS